MFLVDLAAFWVLWILAWTWIFLSHLRAWRDLSRALRAGCTRTIVSWVKLSYQVCPTYLWWLPPHPWASQVLVVAWVIGTSVWRKFFLNVLTSSTVGLISSPPLRMAWIHLPFRPWQEACHFQWHLWESRPLTADPPRWPRSEASSSQPWTGPSDAVWQHDFKRN